MPVISFASSKGGAGKTTSAIILGTELAQASSVVLIDADPAHRLTDWAELAPLPEKLRVVTSRGERAILSELASAKAEAAFVLIDLARLGSWLTSFAMGESDLVIVPSGEEQQDARAAVETLREIEREGQSRCRTIPAAILLCRTKAAIKSRLEKYLRLELAKTRCVLRTELNNRTAFSSLHNAGGGLRDLDPTDVSGIDKAIANALAFTNEVVDLLLQEKLYAQPANFDNIKRFERAAGTEPAAPESRPHQQPVLDAQICIRAPHGVVEAFKARAKADRRTHGDMLEQLLKLSVHPRYC